MTICIQQLRASEVLEGYLCDFSDKRPSNDFAGSFPLDHVQQDAGHTSLYAGPADHMLAPQVQAQLPHRCLVVCFDVDAVHVLQKAQQISPEASGVLNHHSR